MKYQKDASLETEGDNYFLRNNKGNYVSLGCKAFGEFCKNNNLTKHNKVLEIGCCSGSGFNLNYLHENFGFKG